ncbi:kinase-like domain-containing protein [Amylostereum chailletii]|nr:kinase-like domain-containing protein [Amylostereum chailletii]
MSTSSAGGTHWSPPPFHPARYLDPKVNLLIHERWWRDHQVFLQSQGYMLRPRLRPGWKPSWDGSGKSPWCVEDAVYSHVWLKVMDATRISDGKSVYIKQVATGDQESAIACYFSSEEMRRHPDNHSIPILDLFPDESDPSISFMVMPFFRDLDDPPFEHIGEVLDCVEQVLKGLVFMHEQGVAHRDCAWLNLMMDASNMYPRGHHPVNDWLLPDAPYKPRLAVNVKYYIIDYGLSTHFPPGTTAGYVLGTWAQDHDVPELSNDVPYDVFKVDIFTIGNVFQRIFCDTYINLDFVRPLVVSMKNADPSSRPTAAQALEEWRAVCASFTNIGRYRPLRKEDDAKKPYFDQAIVQTYRVLRAGANLLLPDAVLSPVFHLRSLFRSPS